MSPEEWAFKFSEMLKRHREELHVMNNEMWNDISWSFYDPQDGSDPQIESICRADGTCDVICVEL